MIAALKVACLRGIEIDIVLPERGDIRLVDWANRAQVDQIIEPGCRVWLSPAPFDHSKLMVVDDEWLLFGSANWDPRSLQLNFEFAVECYDSKLSSAVGELIAIKLARAQPLTLQALDARGWSVKLRDATARLLSPYL